MAATAWAARHHSNMHHSLSPLDAWKPHECTRAWSPKLKLACRIMFIRNERGMSMSWNGIWLKWSATSTASLIERLISGQIILMHVSKLKSNILNICYDMFFCNFVTCKANVNAVMSKSTYVSFHKVGWELPSGEVSNFVAVLLQIAFSICVPKIISGSNVLPLLGRRRWSSQPIPPARRQQTLRDHGYGLVCHMICLFTPPACHRGQAQAE